MNTCHPDDSGRFLAGQLTGADETLFVEHLSTCDRCQERLEVAAGEAQDWESARELLAYVREDGRHSFAESGPSQNLPTAFRGSADKTIDATALTFLTPSDDPAMMGRVGPYEISGMLGRGGTGIVLRGFDRALNRNVAIKILDSTIADTGAARQRFAREARAMAAISHEHVVPVYAVDEHAGVPYFVMEYVSGGSLERRLAHEGSFDAVSVVRIGLQVAEALLAAHGQGLVHRDIKPGNILLDRGTERVRVTDFGLARVASDASFTRSGFLAGTPQYMAPEQVRGETCDARSDLFSLGCVMHALCTGHAPFRADSVYAVMQRIVHDEPRGIREQNPLIPGWLERFIGRLLAKDPGARFASAAEAASILREELAHLQNPREKPQPPRAWLGTAASGPKYMLRAALVSLVGLGLAAGVGTAIKWRVGREGGTARHSTAEVVSPDSPQPSDVPLWALDGTQQALDRASALEAAWRTTPQRRGADPWGESAAQIRAQLEEISRDLATPGEPPADVSW